MSAMWWFLPLCLTCFAIGWAILWPYACNNWFGWTVLIIRMFVALVISLLIWFIASITNWGMS